MSGPDNDRVLDQVWMVRSDPYVRRQLDRLVMQGHPELACRLLDLADEIARDEAAPRHASWWTTPIPNDAVGTSRHFTLDRRDDPEERP